VLLYDGDMKHMQVTRISFDPYNHNRIYVGTRDLGIILSTDSGKTWSTIPYTNRILYITNFFFKPRGDTVIVSSYGRGLWQIHTRISLIPFAAERFCRGSRCNFRKIPDLEPLTIPINWLDKDVTIFLNGRINGLILSGTEIKKISVTPGTTFKRFLRRSEDYCELNIVENEQGGEGFNDLKGGLATLSKGEIIKGVILKENQLIGIITGQEEFKDEENKEFEDGNITPDEAEFTHVRSVGHESKAKKTDTGSKNPYLFIRTSIPIMGTRVVGRDGITNLFATGFKFKSNANNHVKIMIDSQVISKKVKVMQNGNVEYQLRIPTDLLYGEHTVKIVQKVNRKSITASGSIVKAAIDDIDENMEKEN